jgi:hypothetical protein
MRKRIANVVLNIPNHPSMLNLSGYTDFAQTVNWGLNALGLESKLTVNSLIENADVYFVFGGHLLAVSDLQRMKGKRFFVNLEQLHGFNLNFSQLKPSMQFALENFTILDYTRFNFDFWRRVGLDNPIYFPPSYGENLLFKSPVALAKDIDLLYYGNLGFPDDGQAGYKLNFIRTAVGGKTVRPVTVCLQNEYGPLREELIQRSKMVLSVTLDRVFPSVRAQLLLANGKFIVSSIKEGDHVDDEFKDLVSFLPLESIADFVSKALNSAAWLEELATTRTKNFREHSVIKRLQSLLKEELSL